MEAVARAVAKAIATSAEPVAIEFIRVGGAVHGQRVFLGVLFEGNRNPHSLASEVNFFVEGSFDPGAGSG